MDLDTATTVRDSMGDDYVVVAMNGGTYCVMTRCRAIEACDRGLARHIVE